MENQSFTATIHATPGKVWNVLWNDETYRQWTRPFSETSYARTDWQKGSKALFLDADNNGMVARIEENIPNQYMSIQHLGEIRNGVEDVNVPWSGQSFERYTLKPVGDKTELVVEMPVPPDFLEFFNAAWPKALKILTELSEQ